MNGVIFIGAFAGYIFYMIKIALKASKEPKAKEYLKRFFGIEEKPKYEFKPFDKVLVRDEENEDTQADG